VLGVNVFSSKSSIGKKEGFMKGLAGSDHSSSKYADDTTPSDFSGEKDQTWEFEAFIVFLLENFMFSVVFGSKVQKQVELAPLSM